MDMPPSPGKLFISLFFCSVLASPATCALVTAWESRSLSTPSPSPSRYAFSPGSPSPVLYSPLTLSSSSSRLLSSLLPPRSWGLSASHPLSDTSATLTFGSPPSRSSSPSLRLTGLFFSGDSIRDLLMCWSPEASSSLAPSRGCLCFSHWHGPRPLYTPAGRKSNPGMVTHRTRSIADFTGDRFVHHHHSCKEESRVSVSLHHFPFRRSNASTSRDNLAKPWKALFAYLLHTTGPYRSYCGKGDERSSYRQTPRFSLLHTMGHKKSVEVFASVPTLSRETTRKKGACDTDQTSEGKEGNERHHQCKIDVETVIGVEAHVQLLTASKLFCACPSQLMFTCAARRIAPRHTSSRIDRLVQGCLSRADANPGSTQAANKLADQDRNMGAHAGHQGDLGQSRGEQVAGGSVKGRVTGEAVRSGTHTGRSEARACNASTDDDRRHTDGQRERHEVLEATDQCVQRSTSQGLTHWLPFPLSPKCILRPNIFICPTCLGEPGSLPSPSREAVETALKAAMLLQCEDIPGVLEFDRKCYIYPDLGKNYQISQIRAPIGQRGRLSLPSSGRTIRIRGVHLEEDTAKTVRMRQACSLKSSGEPLEKAEKDESSVPSQREASVLQRSPPEEGDLLLDMNRAGMPLVEIVTEPDLRSAAEAVEFVRELSLLFRSAGVSTCVMADGATRCDLNVSLRDTQTGSDFPRTEVKNVGSVKAIRRAVQFEIGRQSKLLLRARENSAGKELGYRSEKRFWSSLGAPGGKQPPDDYLRAETRMWNDTTQCTVAMRTKFPSEEYFPVRENLLPPIAISGETVQRIRYSLPETPSAKRLRYVKELSLNPKVANAIVGDAEISAYFEEAIAAGAPPSAAAQWLLNEIAGWRNNNRMTVRQEADADCSREENRGSPFSPLNPSARTPGSSRGFSEAEATDVGRAVPLRSLKLTPNKLAEMIRLIDEGQLMRQEAKELLPTLLATWDSSVTELVKSVREASFEKAPKTLQCGAPATTAQSIDEQVEKVLALHPEILERFRKGARNTVDFVVGQILKAQRQAPLSPGSVGKPETLRTLVLEIMTRNERQCG